MPKAKESKFMRLVHTKAEAEALRGVINIVYATGGVSIESASGDPKHEECSFYVNVLCVSRAQAKELSTFCHGWTLGWDSKDRSIKVKK